MRRLRQHFRPLLILVIAALLASPLARVHCELIVRGQAASLAAAGEVICGANVARRLVPGKTDHSQQRSLCPVCMALGSGLANDGCTPKSAKPVWSAIASIRPSAAMAMPPKLLLGGIGSRAPPSNV